MQRIWNFAFETLKVNRVRVYGVPMEQPLNGFSLDTKTWHCDPAIKPKMSTHMPITHPIQARHVPPGPSHAYVRDRFSC